MGFDLVYLLTLSCGLSGLLCGWLLRNPISLVAPSRSAEETNNRNERKRLEQIAKQLTRVTYRVAADVDEHQTKVQEVSDSLFRVDDEGAEEAVVSAVEMLIEANTKMQLQLGEAQNHIKQQEEMIESAVEMALTDGLTGLNNRRAFDRHLQARYELEDCQGANPTSLMLLDIDHFKKLNDEHGHRVGDEVLKHVASLLIHSFGKIGYVARYGGEEFAVVFDDQFVDDVKEIAEKGRANISSHGINIDGLQLNISLSAGIAQRIPEYTIETWIESSDEALYSGKRNGRNCGYWIDQGVARRIEVTEQEEPPATPPADDDAAAERPAQASDVPSEQTSSDAEDLTTAERSAAEASALESDKPRADQTPESLGGDEPSKAEPTSEPNSEKAERRGQAASKSDTAATPKDRDDGPHESDTADDDEVPLATAIVDEPEEVGTIEALHKSTFPTFIKLQTQRLPFSVVVLHVEAPESDSQWEDLTQSSIRGSLRGIDVNRIAFDENKRFVICLPGVDELTAAHRCDAIRAAVCEMSYERTGRSYEVAAASVCAEADESFEEVLERASNAVMVKDKQATTGN